MEQVLNPMKEPSVTAGVYAPLLCGSCAMLELIWFLGIRAGLMAKAVS